MHDLEEIAALFNIHREALAHGNMLTHVRDAALKRLREINEGMKPSTPSTFVAMPLDKEIAGTPAGNAPDFEPEAVPEGDGPVVERRA